MAKVLTDQSNYKNIANKLREYNGENTLYKPDHIPSAIDGLFEKVKSDYGIRLSLLGNPLIIDDHNFSSGNKVNIKLTNENGLSVIERAKVKITGKNLLNKNEFFNDENWIMRSSTTFGWYGQKLNLLSNIRYNIFLSVSENIYVRIVYVEKGKVYNTENITQLVYFVQNKSQGSTSFVTDERYDYYIEVNNLPSKLSKIQHVQLEYGENFTEYEEFYCNEIITDEKGEATFSATDGKTIFLSADQGAKIDCSYYADINKYIEKIIK